MYILLLFHFVRSCFVLRRSPARDRLVRPVDDHPLVVVRPSRGGATAADPDWWKLTGLKKFKCVPHFYRCAPLVPVQKVIFRLLEVVKDQKMTIFSTFTDFDIDVPHVPQVGHKWGTKSSPPQCVIKSLALLLRW